MPDADLLAALESPSPELVSAAWRALPSHADIDFEEDESMRAMLREIAGFLRSQLAGPPP